MFKTSNIANILNFIDSDKIVTSKPVASVQRCTINLVNGGYLRVKPEDDTYVLEECTSGDTSEIKRSTLTDFSLLMDKLEAISDAEIKQVVLE